MTKLSVTSITSGETHVGRNVTKRVLIGLGVAVIVLLSSAKTRAAQAPVNLGKAGSFAILSKSGISTVPPSAITGDIGVSPIDSTAITGFSLILDSTTQFATSTQVTGKVYAASYASPTPANLTTAVGDMEPDHTVLEVFQRGYRHSEKIFRPARVVVNDLTDSAQARHVH